MLVIPIASGKGGVGKSTISANLAVALAKLGHRVGLMDADVYGPSIPTLLGIQDPPVQQGGKIIPPSAHGVKVISMGFFLPKGDAVIWRGPMLHKAVDQFLNSVDWGELDFLIVDLPPGTGDIQLSLCQTIPLTGAVIVSTPQDLAFRVAERAIMMFKKLRTPVLGIIENMSGYECSQCGHHEDIFGKGGAKRESADQQIPFLGEVPLATNIRTASDEGKPLVVAAPDSPAARALVAIARSLADQVSQQQSKGGESAGLEPQNIYEENGEIHITWSDGSQNRVKSRLVRLGCRCASCVDEVSGRQLLREASVPQDVSVRKIEKIGRYAIRFDWSDGHSTGIYTFEHLRDLIPAEKS